jgi:hypothetical protein
MGVVELAETLDLVVLVAERPERLDGSVGGFSRASQRRSRLALQNLTSR